MRTLFAKRRAVMQAVRPLMVAAALLTGCTSASKKPGGFVEDTSDAAVLANRMRMATAYCTSLGRERIPGTFRCSAPPAPPAAPAEPPSPPKASNPAVTPGGGA